MSAMVTVGRVSKLSVLLLLLVFFAGCAGTATVRPSSPPYRHEVEIKGWELMVGVHSPLLFVPVPHHYHFSMYTDGLMADGQTNLFVGGFWLRHEFLTNHTFRGWVVRSDDDVWLATDFQKWHLVFGTNGNRHLDK